MKSPLRKRIPRELKGEIGKYLVVFILMVATIGLVSGFLVADGSMIQAYNEGFEKYNIEDGNFRLGERLYRGQKEAIEDEGIKVYESYYIEDSLSNGSTMRFFKNRTDVNKVCLMEGKLAEKTGEIAIDRMYADNNSLEIGDTLKSADGKYSWKITGYVALPDYSCLFSDNNDTMFDAVKFGVGIVAPEGYTALEKEEQNYSYFWKYEKEPSDELQEKEMAEDLMDIIKDEAKLETYIPRYLNQAIIFTGEDMGSDQSSLDGRNAGELPTERSGYRGSKTVLSGRYDPACWNNHRNRRDRRSCILKYATFEKWVSSQSIFADGSERSDCRMYDDEANCF